MSMKGKTGLLLLLWLASGVIALAHSSNCRTPVVQGVAGAVRPPGEREAIQKSLDLLERSAQQWHAGCVSCHHQALQVVTAEAAQARGFKVNLSFLHDQQTFIQREMARSKSKMEQIGHSAQGPPALVSPNPDMVFGYSLLALGQSCVEPSPLTDAMIRYFLSLQDKSGNWVSRVKQRPPFEASDFAATALVVRAMREFTPSDQALEVRQAIGRASKWLNSARALDTEDRTFRLLGLYWVAAENKRLLEAGNDLLRRQRFDGGWAQADALDSDAYATGESLVALRASGLIDKTSPVYQRGVHFLLTTQNADGSWHVKSRARPIQEYFESGFPHGRDQFISYAATCWATLALLNDDAAQPAASQ